MDDTERTSSPGPRRGLRAHPFLFVVLEAARPNAGGARVSLAGVESVAIGRGEAQAERRESRSRAHVTPGG
jgi:hypothetical protein